MSNESQQTPPDGFDTWQVYWKSRGMPWRTQPEIDEDRQRYLAQRRSVYPDPEKGMYPFKSIPLKRADIEWLLATHENDGKSGPVDWNDEEQRMREGLDLRYANLSTASLESLPLARALLTGATLIKTDLSDAHMEATACEGAIFEGARLYYTNLAGANLEGAKLSGVSLVKTNLSGANLGSADLRSAHISNGNLAGANLWSAHLEGANLVGAHLEGAKFIQAQLEGAQLALANCTGANFARARLDGTLFLQANLTGAYFWRSHLEGADLCQAELPGASFYETHLEGTNFLRANLSGKQMSQDELARIRPWNKDFPDSLSAADLRTAFFDSASSLEEASFGDEQHGFVSLADVRWGGVNLAVVDWANISRLGDDRLASQHIAGDGKEIGPETRLASYQTAVRANRQLATVLRNQGLNEQADRFAYRAQVLQREVLRRQRSYGKWLFSHFLDRLAGYGYNPLQTVAWYVTLIFVFATCYWLIGTHIGPTLSPLGALVFSVTSFHGRGFFPGGVALDDPMTVVAAVEAIVGLVIEVSFIATFTQRYFAR